MIYLDNAATTKVYNDVIHLINYYLTEMFFNPSALQVDSIQVTKAIAKARHQIADILSVNESQIIFTGCGSESNNMVINGAIRGGRGNIVTYGGEHASIYYSCMAKKANGCDVRFAEMQDNGGVNIDSLLELVDCNTRLVSIMHVNNETGAINDIRKIVELVKYKSPKCLVHSDGVQAFCKISTDLSEMNVDFYSISGHKVHAPKGVGALYIKKGVFLPPLVYGGQQEFSLRAGTENVSGIVAFGEAAQRTVDKKLDKYYCNLKSTMLKIFSNNLSDFICNSMQNNSCNNILNISIKGIRGEILLHMLEEDGVYIGLGSACSSKNPTSRVTDGLKLEKQYAMGTIRISFCFENTVHDVEYAAIKICEHVKTLREKLG